MIYLARWLRGAATIEWLLANPDWFAWADICALAFDQAQEARAKQEQSSSPASPA